MNTDCRTPDEIEQHAIGKHEGYRMGVRDGLKLARQWLAEMEAKDEAATRQLIGDDK